MDSDIITENNRLHTDIALLRRALAETALPLEVILAADSFWHPFNRRRYRKLISEGLRDQIAESVDLARSTLKETGNEPPA